MKALFLSFQQTLQSARLLWLLYSITLILGLLAALPFYNTLKIEDQNSRAFLNLLNGFDYTVFSDFLHRSQHSITPLLSLGRWLGLLYLLLSVFFAGGILARFMHLSTLRSEPVLTIGLFWQACSYYIGRFLRLFGVTLLFVVTGGGIWLVIGSLAGLMMSDTLTERGQFWIGLLFFSLFALTATLILCIGDYAKVIMVHDNERTAFRAFGRAGRFVFRYISQTYGLYCLLILIGTVFFSSYFLVDATIGMSNWLTIVLMFLIQQALIFIRVFLKFWSLGIAYRNYERLAPPTFQSATPDESAYTYPPSANTSGDDIPELTS